MGDTDYISVEDAADILGVTVRQARRYQSKVRSKVVGKRVLLHRGDIAEQAGLKDEALQARGGAQNYRERTPRADLVAPGEFLEYLRERESHAERLQQQLIQAAHGIGELETQLAQRLLPQDAEALQQQVLVLQQEREHLAAERNHLQQQHDQLQQEHIRLQQELLRVSLPWWKRIWGT